VSQVCVRAEGLSKRFQLITGRKTALQALRALLRRESFARQHWVLHDLSFTIQKGEKLALIGKNGSGKTTLLRILTGILEQTSGTLELDGAPTALFQASIGFLQDLPVVDNIYLFGAVYGIPRRVLAPGEREVLRLAGLEHLAAAPFKELSLGQGQRLALSIFAQTTNDFLIFDEVFANVDLGFLRASAGFFASLARSDRTVIMTSHDSAFLRKHCQTALWLDEGRLRRYGTVDDVIAEYEWSFLEPSPESAAPGVGRASPEPSVVSR
jgi:ABC-type polysaccharide/polyol phosphate transport system ATPase subunit